MGKAEAPAIARSASAHPDRWFTTLLAPSSAPEPPTEAAATSANIVQYLTELLARKDLLPGW